jgi:hypothetical protein
VWSFRDRLNFNIVYNEMYHEEDQMQDFVRAVEASLRAGLQIEGT